MLVNLEQKKYGIRPMIRDDLRMVLNWRNHPDIRQYMYTNHEISLDEHILWFEKESINDKKKLLIFEENNIPVGFVNFARSSTTLPVEWGFYIAPDARKGTGRALGKHALDYAFSTLGTHKVMGYVIASNVKSLQFHEKLGFQREGILRDQYFDGTHYEAVICLGLLKNEWNN